MINLPMPLWALLMLPFSFTAAAQGAGATAAIEQLEDGDTIVARLAGKSARLQLLGIDAPEDTDNAKLQRDLQVTGLKPEALLQLGVQATEHLGTLLTPGQEVTLDGKLQQRDRYGRIPVVLYTAGGRSINEAMVADGYAMVLGRYPLDAQLKTRLEVLESEAIAEHRGLWGPYRERMQAWSGKEL